MKRLPLLALLTGLLGLGGCVHNAPVPMYQLDSGTAELPDQSAGMAVLLGPVSVADYLQRETLLQRQPDGSLTASTDGRWAGSLAGDIDQLLLRQLSWRLDSQRLVLAPANPGFTPEIQVLLSISRLDSGPQRPAVLEAQWRVLDKAGQLRDSRLVRLEQPHSGTAADQVRAQSQLLQQLAEQLAGAVKPLSGQPAAAAEEPRKATAAPARAREPVPPKIPMAAPVRTDVEVFRF
ncbi:PqiC family protein [Pseudomonas solani]|uniref:PqiC family protein n=1 Tax=Pseudomonas solani TaxID=2731552 RepID=A0AAU7Y3L3_9PSED|nr:MULTISPECIES: PqiC family protein [Pseudomonas]MBB4821224.1 putative lipoprotein YmbA [Pseudomonas alcaligenes]MCU9950663.1 PqiC family protein [Pseudomonas sp. PDM13]MDN4144333.1 PqiC family protein [Pseudomonas tohonis]WCD79903.1 PqiC family protein [Pseudomonas sp. TUM22785]